MSGFVYARAAFLGALTGLALGSGPVLAEDVASVHACDLAAAFPDDPQRSDAVAGVGDGDINVGTALRACEAAVAAAPENLRVLSELARVYYVAKRYDKAQALYVKAADEGYSHAQFRVGMFFVKGTDGFPKDERKAAHYFKMAVNQGNAWAETMLASLYLQGHGLAQDVREGVRLLKQAAGRGLPVAQYSLGYLYETGVGVPRDYAQAATLYREAAAQGNKDAKAKLAELGGTTETSGKEIQLVCNNTTFLLIDLAEKTVKLKDPNFGPLEFIDGATTDFIFPQDKLIGDRSPGAKQFVLVGENVITFGARAMMGKLDIKNEYQIDRRTGVLTHGTDSAMRCSVLPSKQF